MDFALLIKFAHVSAAMVWLGGGLAMILAATLMGPNARPDQIMSVIRMVALIGPRLLMPASIATLLTGLWLAIYGGYGWPAWLVLGLVGIAFTAALGALVLGPTSERAARTAASLGNDAAMGDARRLIRIGRFDYVVQFAIVFLMVAKPDWSEVPLLAAIGLAVLAGAALTLRPVRSPAVG
jgi:uncharacterized membrane protein